MMAKYYHGVVSEFDDKAGYGYIEASPGEDVGTKDQILVHRRSLRSRSIKLQAKDFVCFRLDFVPRGLLAVDVHRDRCREDRRAEVSSPPLKRKMTCGLLCACGLFLN
jgi:cold shock CspA family protein